MASTKILHGDCLDILRRATSNSVDSIVTDPPYGLSFMGKKWDYDVPSKEIWQECLRVLKPGGYLLSFAGTRTQHRMAVNIEDAGFEIRDMIAWIYGSGFPKSLNIGKAVAKAMGEDVKIGTAFKAAGEYGGRNLQDPTPINDREQFRHIPQTEEAKQWEGWGTALKPALEPITVARKPLSEKTVAENVLKWGTGGINIDGSRVGTEVISQHGRNSNDTPAQVPQNEYKPDAEWSGRFPANLIHDGSDEVVSLFPDSGNGKFSKGSVRTTKKDDNGYELGFLNGNSVGNAPDNYGDNGSAARFFYCAKASKADRDEGNKHPTVKPTKLMQYLVKLVTPKGGVVLDPFMGSGSTGKACKLEDFDFIGIEMDAEYIEIAKARINNIKK